jgi:hypothetical protein
MGRTLRCRGRKINAQFETEYPVSHSSPLKNNIFLLYAQQSKVLYRSYTKIYEVCYHRYSFKEASSNHIVEVCTCTMK